MSLVPSYASWSPRGATGAISEDSCAADPVGPASDWVYGDAAIGFVMSGWFEYRTQGDTILAAPGSMVFGNAGEPFNVRHVDALGNRRLVVSFTRGVLEEVARETGADPRFGAIALPPGQRATRMFAMMRACSQENSKEILYALARAALAAEQPWAPERISSRDRRRVQSAVRHIEAHFDEPCSLQALADLTGVSRFHFARVFAAIVGQSPNQYLINTRIRSAADRLITTTTPIAQIAFDVGFNDISHFYACFRDAFGCTPRRWRLRA